MDEVNKYYKPDGVADIIKELSKSKHPFAVALNYSYNSVRLIQPKRATPIYVDESGSYAGSIESDSSSEWDTMAAGFNYGTRDDAKSEGRSCYIVYRKRAGEELKFETYTSDSTAYYKENEST
ncbi:hypothetical protein IWW50_003305, partial [Coemansia erecta]